MLALCERHGHADRAFVFASTSKVTFAGAGVAVFASSPANVKWQLTQMERRTIGPDKLNQLRHVRFLKNEAGISALMAQHATSIVPKFNAVQENFERLLGGTGVATWTRPEGGYFVSFDVLDGCARRVIELASQAGITVVPAGIDLSVPQGSARPQHPRGADVPRSRRSREGGRGPGAGHARRRERRAADRSRGPGGGLRSVLVAQDSCSRLTRGWRAMY